MSVVLVQPDWQAPFHHPDTLDFLLEVRNLMDCDEVVNIGDEYDFYALSRYIKLPEAHSFPEEFALAQEFMYKMYKHFPNVKVCVSNHTWRPYKTAIEAGIPEIFMRGIHEVAEAPPGWQWKDHWRIDGVRYEHGDAFRGSALTVHNNIFKGRLESTVFGHHHQSFGVVWHRTGEHRLFTAATGCLIDEDRYAFKYDNKKRGQLGCLVVEHGVPIAIPMLTDKHKRWTGKLTL